MSILGGPQADHIETDSGENSIYPGGGDDEVIGGTGYDTVHAGTGPDGDDVYDLLPKPEKFGFRPGGVGGRVDYSLRSEPLRFIEGIGGAAGEQDRIADATIVGGYGDDTFVAPANEPGAFEGGPGDDLIVGQNADDALGGNSGNDRVYGNGGNDKIVGGTGDDQLEGGPGDDEITETYGPLEYERGDPLEEAGGNDTGRGGPGDDLIALGVGNDAIFGEEGDDSLAGGAGDDLVEGGEGDDKLIGGSGDDRLLGGTGADVLYDGEQARMPFSPGDGDPAQLGRYFSGTDELSCGEGQDSAYIDAPDQARECEAVYLPRVFTAPKLRRDRRRGTALLTFNLPSAGRLTATGPGIAGTTSRARAEGSRYVVRVPLKPLGRARTELRQSGRCNVRVSLLYRRAKGGYFEHDWSLSLIRRPAS
jgi:hypothetical protein